MKKNVKSKLIYFGLFTIIFLVILSVKHSFDKNKLFFYVYNNYIKCGLLCAQNVKSFDISLFLGRQYKDGT